MIIAAWVMLKIFFNPPRRFVMSFPPNQNRHYQRLILTISIQLQIMMIVMMLRTMVRLPQWSMKHWKRREISRLIIATTSHLLRCRQPLRRPHWIWSMMILRQRTIMQLWIWKNHLSLLMKWRMPI